MNWDTVATSASVATAFSTFISGAIALIYYKKQRQVDYMYDYRKHILEKRKDAYGLVEEIISQITVRRFIPNTNKPLPGFIDVKGRSFHIFNEKIIKCLALGFWLSDDMCGHLKKLNSTIFELGQEVDRMGDTDEIELAVAADSYSLIKNIKEPITKTYFVDICGLDNIEQFKQKRIFY